MKTERNPLFTLSVDEFIAVLKEYVSDVVDLKLKNRTIPEKFPDEDHFNISELANFLNCSKVSIHKYKKMGMPFYRIGRKVIFRKSEVLEFMRKFNT